MIEGEDPGDAVDPVMQAQPASVLLESVPPDVEDAPDVDTTDEEASGSDTSDDGTDAQDPSTDPDPDPGEP